MLFKEYFNNSILEESFRGASYFSNDNQIVALPKTGWFTPYSLTYSQLPITDKKIYKFGDKLPLNDWLLEPKNYQKLQKILNDVSIRLSNFGLPTQNQHVIFVDFDKNEEKLKNKGIRPDLYWIGAHVPGSNLILIDKNLIKTDRLESAENALTHEVFHFIWNQLSKDNKNWFINWYKENVLHPTIKSYKSEDDTFGERSGDLIFNKFEREKTGNIQTDIEKILPKIISEVKPGLKSEAISHIKNAIKSQVRKDKNILNDYDKFMTLLKRIKFPAVGKKYDDFNISNEEGEKLRMFAKEKGLVPSEYAATSPEELWSETLEYATKNIHSISRELRNAVLAVITGTVA